MKDPIFKGNPVDELLYKQGYIKSEATEPPEEQERRQTAIDTPAPIATLKPSRIQLLQLFGDYGIPYKMGTDKKDRRVQLLLYPEEQQKAANVALELGISFNELAAAAINKLCRDYEKAKGDNV